MENELEWFLVPNTQSKYEITKCGLLRKSESKKLCNQCLNKGYLIVSIKYKGEYRSISVHQLMAITFLNHTPAGQKGLCVNHINEIKTDNRLENLEIVTQLYNIQYSSRKKNRVGSNYYIAHNENINHYYPIIKCKTLYVRLGVFINKDEAREVVRQYYINNNLNYEDYERSFKNEGKRKEIIRLYNIRKNRVDVDNCQQLS